MSRNIRRKCHFYITRINKHHIVIIVIQGSADGYVPPVPHYAMKRHITVIVRMKENVTPLHEQRNAQGLDVHPDNGIRTLYVNSGIIRYPFDCDKFRISLNSYICSCPFVIKLNLPGKQFEAYVSICCILIKDFQEQSIPETI